MRGVAPTAAPAKTIGTTSPSTAPITARLICLLPPREPAPPCCEDAPGATRAAGQEDPTRAVCKRLPTSGALRGRHATQDRLDDRSPDTPRKWCVRVHFRAGTTG